MIHPRILKETSSQIIEPLKKLFRQSLDEAKLPEDGKKQMSQHYSNQEKGNNQKITDQSVWPQWCVNLWKEL